MDGTPQFSLRATPPGIIAWPTPFDFLGDAALTGVPALRPEHLPAALAGFCFDTAARMGSDPAAVALCAIVACASVASDLWAIQPKRSDDTWTENPRLWGAIIGEPSQLKTPLIRAATRPIDMLEAHARDRHAEAMRAWNLEATAAKIAKSAEPPRPPMDRRIVEDATVEALGQVLRAGADAPFRAPAGKILVRQDELAEWLGAMDRYAAGGRGGKDRGAFLRAFNGGSHIIDRVRGAIVVPNWSACILGGIQPDPIRRIAAEAADDGLLQRFLYAVPECQGDGEDRRPDHAAMARYGALFPALANLHPPCAPGMHPRPVVLHEKAHIHREAIDGLIKAQAGMPDTSPRLRSALGKWRGTFARLALTFHLVEIADALAQGMTPPTPDVIGEATARSAAGYMRQVLLPHLLRAEATLFSSVQTGHARWIAGFVLANEAVKAKKRVAARDIQQAYAPLRAPEHRRELGEVMAQLETVGWVRAEPPPNRARDVAAWQVNPRLHILFAEAADAERARRRAAQAAVADAVRRAKEAHG